MRLSIQHSTIYYYDSVVHLAPHTLRLRPRTNSSQQLVAFEIQIAPVPAGTTECLDQDGNLTLHAWFDTSTKKLEILSRFRVEMSHGNPFDFVLNIESVNLPLFYSEPLRTALAPYRDDFHISDSVRQFAKSLAASVQWNSLSFLVALNRKLFHDCRHVTRPEGQPWSSDLTLSLLEGSCRDLAVLFCDVCRVMGIAARFVSGYECAALGQQNSYMHAWAEAYLSNVGWRGYDPSRGLAVSNTHVAVAAGFNYDLAAPVTGFYSGGSGSRMEAWLSVNVDSDSRSTDSKSEV